MGVLTNYKDMFLKRRYLDDFDYVSFLNEGRMHGSKERISDSRSDNDK